ncbi:hypothetical protein J7438_25905 [Thalassotalea sp. G20_0]|uniref:hypothetical protein n=1 Tax=Thalassotalea sp. G20_0 TaxID=2821093 RepID=UPI001ADCF4FF|nr:hypothetical protein [Thalassotalea sp. G20_0]MBO9497494.1 hypothetical protein [Thalassotalea sp. G20_0]
MPIESDNMMNLEDGLQRALNEAGQLGTQELLKLFEPPNKEPIVVNQQKWSYKGKVLKHYETLYGCVPVERSVYQGVRGGHSGTASLSCWNCWLRYHQVCKNACIEVQPNVSSGCKRGF